MSRFTQVEVGLSTMKLAVSAVNGYLVFFSDASV